jgi:hypothetical protein
MMGMDTVAEAYDAESGGHDDDGRKNLCNFHSTDFVRNRNIRRRFAFL